MKEDRTRGRKEKKDRTGRRGCGRESLESTEHRDKNNQGTKFHFKNNYLFSLTFLCFIEIERRGFMVGRCVATVISALVDRLTRLGVL